MRIAFFTLSLLVASFNANAQIDGFPVQAKIEHGIIEGVYDTNEGLQKFFGVPYAKPPLGQLRWKAPQPPDNWKGVRATKAFGPRPVQAPVFADMVFRSDGMSEDCLYLNVWTPARRNTTGLPVLVYFYGGGFVAGDASEPRYDGARMAKKGIVVVSVNYRLNIFGFFAHPELSKETSYRGSGNYGLLDQHAALKWVQKNIAVFGGDPRRVTIAGESAGSISVSAQMVSPLSKDLIAGAIGESGAAIYPTLAPVPLAEAEKEGAQFGAAAGYPSLAMMRALTTRELYEIYVESKRFGFPTVVDGYFYPAPVPEIIAARKQAQVPLLLGWNSAEIPPTAFMQGLPYTADNFQKRVRDSYDENSDAILAVYPHSTEQEIERSAMLLGSDRFINYSTWKWFDLQRKNSSKPVYRYLYNKLRPPLTGETPDPKMRPPVGAPHACEIEYCLGNLHLVKAYAWTPDDFKVSETMMSYFANFIITGNPNGGDLPHWPSAEPDDNTPPVMIIDVKSRVEDAPDDKRFTVLDKVFGKN